MSEWMEKMLKKADDIKESVESLLNENAVLRAKLKITVEALEAIYINGPKHEFDADTAQEALEKIREEAKA